MKRSPPETICPWILDGAIGTELERRGVPTPLPLWSAAALLKPVQLPGLAIHGFLH